MRQTYTVRYLAVSVWGRDLKTVDEESLNYLRSSFESAGFEIVALGDPRAQFYVAFEHDSTNLRLISNQVPLPKRYLIIFEPRSVHPRQYLKSVRARYGSVFVPTKYQVLDKRDVVYGGGGFYKVMDAPLGQPILMRPVKTLAIVNENKFSFVRKSLYTFRATAIEEFGRLGFKVNLGGKNWDKSIWWHVTKQAWHFFDAIFACQLPDLSKFRLKIKFGIPGINYAGEVMSAVQHLSESRFALVIENEPTYVTEKLFLAIQAGSVPIYVGPPLREFGIPEQIAIPLSANKSAIKKLDLILSDEDMIRISEAGWKWASSPQTLDKWLQRNIFDRLVAYLGEALE